MVSKLSSTLDQSTWRGLGRQPSTKLASRCRSRRWKVGWSLKVIGRRARPDGYLNDDSHNNGLNVLFLRCLCDQLLFDRCTSNLSFHSNHCCLTNVPPTTPTPPGQLKVATSLAAAATNGGRVPSGGIYWEGPSSHPINVPGHAVALIRTASEISHKIMAVQSEMSSAIMLRLVVWCNCHLACVGEVHIRGSLP